MQPELLAPAGDFDCLRAAVANGADAVYFGLPRFNARLRADNFTDAQLPEIVRFAHAHAVKAYVAFNTLVFTGELEAAADQLRLCHDAGVDALIVQDLGLVRLAREAAPGLPIHASTQMTITSPEGVRFARDLGVERVVLARELSLRELRKFDGTLPLEVFVHGALCVAYSGQCLTSESLGLRSANRGECAQACRMPYELVVDGAVRDLGDRRYLLSPQDLAAAREIPELLRLGVRSFKIEGRLKSPEYVAAVCAVYRKALDAALADAEVPADPSDQYALEMTFSRGFYSGWFHGVNHQKLVSARFGKKRGPLAGRVRSVARDAVELDRLEIPLRPGDGIVFDTGGDTNAEQGGRIFRVEGNRISFGRSQIDLSGVRAGDRVWKTSDPALDAALRRTFSGRIDPVRRPLRCEVRGRAGEPMRIAITPLDAPAAPTFEAESSLPLDTARNRPLTDAALREHLDRFGDRPWRIEVLANRLEGPVLLPIAELNRIRRALALQLDHLDSRAPASVRPVLDRMIGTLRTERHAPPSDAPAHLSVLCRTMEQLAVARDLGVGTLYADFEDIRRYRDAVELVRSVPAPGAIFLATPRIQKAGEQGFFKLIENARPDGVLVRNPGAIAHFAATGLACVGDFSLNVANPLSAAVLRERGLERLTISYDLNAAQVLDLLAAAPPDWFELTLHQHMPMFHMEHCVFAAFLSDGTDHTNCGRPCDQHRVHLRDRVGVEHPLRADVGCRNTLFNAVAQTGALHYAAFRAAGLTRFRVELLEESGPETGAVLQAYRALLEGGETGQPLWRALQARSQLGVTRGTLEEAAR